MDRRLAEIAQRRVDALRTEMAQGVALRLLREQGSVTAEQVAAELTHFVRPADNILMAIVAAKTAAAIGATTAALEAAQRAADEAVRKVAKYEALFVAAQSDARAAREVIAKVQAECDEAQELAAYAATQGDASLSPEPIIVAASAGVAQAKGSVS